MSLTAQVEVMAKIFAECLNYINAVGSFAAGVVSILVWMRLYPPAPRVVIEMNVSTALHMLNVALQNYRLSLVQAFAPADVGPWSQWNRVASAAVLRDDLVKIANINDFDQAWVSSYMILIDNVRMKGEHLATLEISSIEEARHELINRKGEVSELLKAVDSAIAHVHALMHTGPSVKVIPIVKARQIETHRAA